MSVYLERVCQILKNSHSIEMGQVYAVQSPLRTDFEKVQVIFQLTRNPFGEWTNSARFKVTSITSNLHNTQKKVTGVACYVVHIGEYT